VTLSEEPSRRKHFTKKREEVIRERPIEERISGSEKMFPLKSKLVGGQSIEPRPGGETLQEICQKKKPSAAVGKEGSEVLRNQATTSEE